MEPTVFEQIDEDKFSELAREDDPNQIARILDDILATYGWRIVSGYNERHGYYLVKEE